MQIFRRNCNTLSLTTLCLFFLLAAPDHAAADDGVTATIVVGGVTLGVGVYFLVSVSVGYLTEWRPPSTGGPLFSYDAEGLHVGQPFPTSHHGERGATDEIYLEVFRFEF